MSRIHLAAGAALIAATLAATALAQQPAPPPAPPLFATTKVDGTDGVYVFRYQGHQALFVVTPEGVIATDPIGERRPQAVQTYIAEIRKITQAPIRYVVYSHHHFDHIAGGKPFKDLGATFVGHARGKAQLLRVKNPDVVIPDLTVGDSGGTLQVGGTTLNLVYVGRNHTDNMLVMQLPKEKLIFTVDFIPIQGVFFRNLPDGYPLELESSLEKVLAMDWDRMLTGHPGPGGRLGTKDDVRNT